MRRKKKKEEEGSWLLLLLVAVLLAAPIALFFARVHFASKARETQDRLRTGESCLDLDEDERTELRYKKAELQRVQSITRAAMQRGADAGLAVNKDGSLSARSNLGKSIRAVLEKYEPLKASLTNDIEQLEAAPDERRKEFSFNLRQERACGWGLRAWLLVFVLSYGYSLIATKESSMFVGAMLAGLAALIMYSVGYFAHARAVDNWLDESNVSP